MHVYVITKYVNPYDVNPYDADGETHVGIARTKRRSRQKITDDVNKCFAGHVKSIKWYQAVNGIAHVEIDTPIHVSYTYTKFKI